MADIALFNHPENPDRRTQELRDRLDPLHFFSDRDFRNRYRFNKHNFLLIVADLRPFIAKAGSHGALNVVQQLALALRLYATGQFQSSTGMSFPSYFPSSFPSRA